MINKFEIVQPYIIGRRVLDVGCIGNQMNPEDFNKSLHALFRQVVKEIVGIDIQKDKVEKLQKLGWNIYYGDAENLKEVKDLQNQKFDVIIALELIEHLSNVGKFLEGVRELLSNKGVLILSTPNPFCLKHIIGRGLLNKESYICHEHVAWYDSLVLKQLLKRYGFKIRDVYFLPPVSGHPIDIISRIIYKISKKLGGNDLLIICTL